MRRFADRVALVVFVVLAGCTTSGAASTTTTTTASTSTSTSTSTTTTTEALNPPEDFEVGRAALQSLALTAGDDVDLKDLGFAQTVSLGLHNRLTFERSVDELQTVDGWVIPVSEYAGFSGPFNPLETLRSAGSLAIDEGDHPHCANPPLEPPSGFETASRIHAQPKETDSCIDWFSVDLWIVEGEIRAVTLELFGP